MVLPTDYTFALAYHVNGNINSGFYSNVSSQASGSGITWVLRHRSSAIAVHGLLTSSESQQSQNLHERLAEVPRPWGTSQTTGRAYAQGKHNPRPKHQQKHTLKPALRLQTPSSHKRSGPYEIQDVHGPVLANGHGSTTPCSTTREKHACYTTRCVFDGSASLSSRTSIDVRAMPCPVISEHTRTGTLMLVWDDDHAPICGGGQGRS